MRLYWPEGRPFPVWRRAKLLEKSQLRHLSNSSTCIRHCQLICRGSLQKNDDLRQFFHLANFLVLYYEFKRAFTPLGVGTKHPSFPTCIGHCQAALPRCTSMSRLPSAAREASYALSRLKKLEARGSTHHTTVLTSAMSSGHALLAAFQECSVQLRRSTFDTLLSPRNICR